MIRYINALTEYRVRRERAKQEAPGGLIHFVKHFWKILEPKTAFIDGWVVRAICQHLEAVTDGRITRLLINVSPGSTKPVHVDELVLTNQGYIRLGDIKIGDMVMTHKGRMKEVLAVHEQGTLSLLKLYTFSGREVRAATDHPFLTPTGWVELGKLKAGNYVGIPRVEEYPDVGSMSPEEARLLGYLVGDGCVSQRSLCFVNMDREAINDFIKCAEFCGFHAYETEHQNKKVRASKIVLKSSPGRWSRSTEPPVLEWLRKHNLYRSNSYTKRIPLAVFRSGPTAIANFIGAYWSCDGMVKIRHKGNKTTTVAAASTVSRELAFDIQRALGILNIQTRIRQQMREMDSIRQANGEYYYYLIMTSERSEVAKMADLPGLIARKKDIAKLAFLDRFESHAYADEVLSVMEDGQGDCRCLTVADDSSFVVNGIAVHNSLITNVFWPAWEWSAKNNPHERYISFSYNSHLTERDNGRMLSLLKAPEFQAMYGTRFKLTKEGQEQLATDKTGWKLATSVGGVGTGERGSRVLIDDPHAVKGGESKVIRENTVLWFEESITNRLNDLEKSAIVVVMQRIHDEDVAGIILSKNLGYEHLMIPMEYDKSRHCRTSIGWEDPRKVDGELAWPERFPTATLDEFRKRPFMWAAQYMQTPQVRGGNIFRYEWWQKKVVPKGMGIDKRILTYVVASLDTAYTTKKINDPSALTVWGCFVDPKDRITKAILLDAWTKHLDLHGVIVEREKNETYMDWARRASPKWGLVEWVTHTCQKMNVDKLLIESTAAGHSTEQELRRLFKGNKFGIQMVPPKGDKEARAHAVTFLFTEGLVYAPGDYVNEDKSEWEFRKFADLVISEMARFPKGRDDLTDTGTMALKHLRDINVIARKVEVRQAEEDERRYERPLQPLYPG